MLLSVVGKCDGRARVCFSSLLEDMVRLLVFRTATSDGQSLGYGDEIFGKASSNSLTGFGLIS